MVRFCGTRPLACGGSEAWIDDGPAGDDPGEARDVGLGVAAVDAERVQFEDLAREVLVEAASAIAAGLAVGADRLRVVEIDQHRGVLLDGLQHVAEAAEHVRADRLALEAAGHDPHGGALAGRDAEMVGPELHQPLDERCVGRCRMADARCGLLPEDLARTRAGLRTGGGGAAAGAGGRRRGRRPSCAGCCAVAGPALRPWHRAAGFFSSRASCSAMRASWKLANADLARLQSGRREHRCAGISQRGQHIAARVGWRCASGRPASARDRTGAWRWRLREGTCRELASIVARVWTRKRGAPRISVARRTTCLVLVGGCGNSAVAAGARRMPWPQNGRRNGLAQKVWAANRPAAGCRLPPRVRHQSPGGRRRRGRDCGDNDLKVLPF